MGSNGTALFSARQPVLLYRLVAMAYVRTAEYSSFSRMMKRLKTDSY